MWRNIVIAVLTGIISLSCARNVNSVKADNTDNDEPPVDQVSNVLGEKSEEEGIRDLLHTQDELATKWNRLVLSVKKVNFGISGGDNWLVEWSNAETQSYTNLSVYLIDNLSIKNDYDLSINNNKDSESVHGQFDIMKEIPGTHIGNGTSSIGDFNGDGLDEVFKYSFSGRGNFIVIKGYDAVTDDFQNYCSIPFRIIDPENGPAPAEFMTYKGMDGVKVYLVESRVASGPTLPPEPPNPDNRKWFFYTWDEAKREYVRVEEVVE